MHTVMVNTYPQVIYTGSIPDTILRYKSMYMEGNTVDLVWIIGNTLISIPNWTPSLNRSSWCHGVLNTFLDGSFNAVELSITCQSERYGFRCDDLYMTRRYMEPFTTWHGCSKVMAITGWLSLVYSTNRGCVVNSSTSLILGYRWGMASLGMDHL